VCKQGLKKKIAVQIQHLLTQVFTGGIIFPRLLSPKLLCVAQLTPAGTFLCREGTKGKWIVQIDWMSQEVYDWPRPELLRTISLARLTFIFLSVLHQGWAWPLPTWPSDCFCLHWGSYSKRPISQQRVLTTL
jgi:hypothetical protein